jgi:phosphomannomutase
MEWKKLQSGSDIRGVASGDGATLTPDVMRRIGGAFVAWLADRLGLASEGLTVSVGRDIRLTGTALMSALMGGMASAGVRVLDFGLASTPATSMSTVTPGFDCDGAVMLTASHLPPGHNRCKFFTARGGLDKADITELLARTGSSRWVCSRDRCRSGPCSACCRFLRVWPRRSSWSGTSRHPEP